MGSLTAIEQGAAPAPHTALHFSSCLTFALGFWRWVSLIFKKCERTQCNQNQAKEWWQSHKAESMLHNYSALYILKFTG